MLVVCGKNVANTSIVQEGLPLKVDNAANCLGPCNLYLYYIVKYYVKCNLLFLIFCVDTRPSNLKIAHDLTNQQQT